MNNVTRALILLFLAMLHIAVLAGRLAATGPDAEPSEAPRQLEVRLAGSKAGWPILFNRSFELVLHNLSSATIKLLSVALTTPRPL